MKKNTGFLCLCHELVIVKINICLSSLIYRMVAIVITTHKIQNQTLKSEIKINDDRVLISEKVENSTYMS